MDWTVPNRSGDERPQKLPLLVAVPTSNVCERVVSHQALASHAATGSGCHRLTPYLSIRCRNSAAARYPRCSSVSARAAAMLPTWAQAAMAEDSRPSTARNSRRTSRPRTTVGSIRPSHRVSQKYLASLICPTRYRSSLAAGILDTVIEYGVIRDDFEAAKAVKIDHEVAHHPSIPPLRH